MIPRQETEILADKIIQELKRCPLKGRRFLDVCTGSGCLALTIASLPLLLCSCAEIVAPPGGPVDKRGPQLISSDPINGATNVAPSDIVTLTFSERLIAPERGRPVFISPRQIGDVKIEWKSERIIINFPDSFRADQTYLISVM